MKGLGSMGLLLAGVLAVAGVVAWIALGDAPPPQGGGRPPYILPVTLRAVSRRVVRPSVKLTGTVRSQRRAALAFETGGVVASLGADEAGVVEAGAVVASLDAAYQEVAVERARAALTLAQRRLQALEAGSRKEAVERLRADLAAADADAELARLEVDRGRTLRTSATISQSELDRLVATQDAANARREAAHQRLAEALAGARVEDLAIARASVELARQALETAKVEKARTDLKAPWRGVVVTRYVSAGDYVATGAPVFELVDLDHLEVRLEIPSRWALRLGETPRVVIALDERPDVSIETALDAPVPAADARSRNFTGIVRLGPDDEGTAVLRPGMFVRATLLVSPIEGALVVPPDCIRMTEAGPIVVRASAGEDGKPVAELIPVRVLARDATGAAIESLGPPLSPGDRVVETGVDLAFPQAPLLPRPRKGEDEAGAGADDGQGDGDGEGPPEGEGG